jgi:hypothetical protein
MALVDDVNGAVMVAAAVDERDDQMGEPCVAQDQPSLQLLTPLKPGRTECMLPRHRDALSRVVVR